MAANFLVKYQTLINIETFITTCRCLFPAGHIFIILMQQVSKPHDREYLVKNYLYKSHGQNSARLNYSQFQILKCLSLIPLYTVRKCFAEPNGMGCFNEFPY